MGKPEVDYGSVQVLVAVENLIVHRGICDAMRQRGFRSVVSATSHVQLCDRLGGSTPDLIVLADEMGSVFNGDFIREIRYGRMGSHPFPVVLMLMGHGGHDHIKQASDCGVDDMLLLPASTEQVLTRIATLTSGRKPFVVTRDYTGPDRRANLRPNGAPTELIPVPNPLATKASGAPLPLLARDVVTTARRIAALNLARQAEQVQWLAASIQSLWRGEGAPMDGAFSAHLRELTAASAAITMVAGSDNTLRDAIAEMDEALIALVEDPATPRLAALVQTASCVVSAVHCAAPIPAAPPPTAPAPQNVAVML